MRRNRVVVDATPEQEQRTAKNCHEQQGGEKSPPDARHHAPYKLQEIAKRWIER
jgi:hypothetical protein